MRTIPLACVGLMLIGVASCTTWTSVPLESAQPGLGSVEVWTGDRMTMVRDLQVRPDSVFGRFQGPGSSRVAFPRADVDSLRVASTDGSKPLILGAGLAIVLFYAWASKLAGLR